MEEIILEAERRNALTKGQLKSYRYKGFIPAVVYGPEQESTSLFVKEKELNKVLRSLETLNVIIQLKFDNTSKSVLIKSIQRDVFTRKFLHVDFYAISLKKEIEIEVPIHIVGEAPGVKSQGGVLEHILREIKVRCLPEDIPSPIEVDVSGLNIGDNIFLKDLKLPSNIEVLTDANAIVVNIVAPAKVEEVAAPAEAVITAAEPEVISKGKKEIPEEEAASVKESPAKQP
ncbi:MAG: 50S ribosomal protein L25/general stress protein Ctc [Elusimicrobiota bacterium]|nr:50S ribosomal protein L25/general stress protein Ctc [Elusimicrobiota bacterium]